MNIRITLLFFSFFSFFVFSQTHRFIYELKFKKDSLSEKFDKENMILDINMNEVQFYEFRAIRIDSINSKSNGFSNYAFPFAKLKRNLASEKNINYFFLGGDYFAFESTDNIIWKIKSEIKIKNKMNLQKAITNFGGRIWEAWFNTDIPFSEGPYKFTGLPGLIVEIKDTKNNFYFELTKIEKPQNINSNIVETLFKIKPIKINFEKYKELLIGNYNDPYSRFRSMKPGSWAIGRADDTYVTTIEELAKITKEEQAEIIKNNNPIELDKAIDFANL